MLGNDNYRRQLSDSYDALSDVLIISGQSRRAIDYARLGLAGAEKLATDHPNDRKAQAALADRYITLGIALMEAGHTRRGRLGSSCSQP